ncbi:MAG TPA: hypothetical protein VFB80_15845 [Pirellulaceae bacterium]|nr:hypothetical protein [Pirellulaceae bacterium]
MLRAVANLRQVAAVAAWLAASAMGLPVASAQGPWHYLNKADMPPGAIGLRQLQRGGPLPGYFQPVEVTAPAATLLSVVSEGEFSEAKREKLLAGMLIGQVYRLKVSNIPGREGTEIFPTIEVIDRLYPPPGQAARFPIPVELTEEEIKMAVDGRYVLRVIYVEEPRTALPLRDQPGRQRYFEIRPGDDAMETADRLGRPVAILRMGSRVPLPDEDQSHFLYHQPPVQLIEELPPALPRNQGLEERLPAPPRLP